MKLTVNGNPEEHEVATLAELVVKLELGDAKVATALNGAFVPVRVRDGTALTAGDRVEIVAPRQGG